MKHFMEQIFCIFNRQNLVLLLTCSTTALTTKSITLTKIVHRTRDCVGIMGVQHIDGPLQVKHWGVRTPATPAALTPMKVMLHL